MIGYKAHELGERANQLLKDKGNLIDENNELKKQIEEMKCCENCKHYNQDFPPPFCLNCKTGFNNDYRKRDYWEIKEIKEND